MKNFREILEKNYTKKSAVANSEEISLKLYNILKNSQKALQEIGRVSHKVLKPNMFTIEIYTGKAGLNWDAPPLKTKQHNKQSGRRAIKTYEYISIRYKDWFNGETVRRNFKSAKTFNAYLEMLNNL